MRFRILGPLQVDVDGRPVAVGGPKPRTLLAVLLVVRGETVSVDRLVDALWPRHSPDGAVSALRAYVWGRRAGAAGRALVDVVERVVGVVAAPPTGRTPPGPAVERGSLR